LTSTITGGLTCSLGYDDLYYDTDRTTLFDVLDFDQMESVNNIIVEHEEFDILPRARSLRTTEYPDAAGSAKEPRATGDDSRRT